MATAVFETGERRLDRYFFPGMALLILETVFLGFAGTYYPGLVTGLRLVLVEHAEAASCDLGAKLARAIHGG